MPKGKAKTKARARRVGFLGFGRMGAALADGAVASGVLAASALSAHGRSDATKKRARARTIAWVKTGSELFAQSDIVFLCVKPQQMADAVAAAKAGLSGRKRPPLFVSIAAGLTTERLEAWLGDGVPVVRVMPNTPSLHGAGASAMCRGRWATPAHERAVAAILRSVGDAVAVRESDMDAVTALSGSGPAYIFLVTEALIEAAVAAGLEAGLARRLAHRTVYGAGVMLERGTESADALRAQVTSPGGTTAAAIDVFETGGVRALVVRAVRAAAERSRELAGS